MKDLYEIARQFSKMATIRLYLQKSELSGDGMSLAESIGNVA